MSILTQDTEEESGKSMERSVREPLVRALRVAMEDGESRSSGSGTRGLARTFLLIDLGALVGYLFGNRGSNGGGAEALAQMVPEQAVETTASMETEQDSGGRGILSKLFLLGAVVGLGYVLRTRMGSMDRVVEEATDRAQTVTDEGVMRMGETAGRTEVAADEAADTIEEAGEMAAERVEETGEMAADQMESAGETVEAAEQQAEEKAEEMTEGRDEGGEDEQSEE
jgi:hypothetical protein